MDQSPTFARQFARLLWLLMHDAGNVDEQKMALRALATVCRLGSVTLRARDGRMVANRHLVPVAMSGVAEVLQQLRSQGVEKVKFEKGTPARELLGFVKLLAGPAGNFAEQLAALNATHVDAVVAAPVVSSEAPTVASSEAPPVASSEAPTVVSPAVAPVAPVAPAAPAAPVAPVAPAAPGGAEAARATEAAAAIMAELGSRDVTKLSPEALFRALDRAGSADDLTRVLDDVVALAEHSVRAGKGPVVATLMHEITVRDSGASNEDIGRAYQVAFRRLAKPAPLRAVAALIPKRPEKKQQYYQILARAGEDGADAVIEQVNQAPTAADRRQLMDVFRELEHGVAALVRMLGDSRWFVVRSAAELLGEVGAAGAEAALIELLRHGDDRVRRAATNALLKLGSPEAMRRVYESVNDESPEVRMQVAASLGARRDHRASSTLLRAIEAEQDADVQLAMIAALGRVGTPEAIQRLVKMAEPEGRLFKKKDSALRVAAVQALGDARTPAAVNALRTLLDDKDRDVRDTASRALAQPPR